MYFPVLDQSVKLLKNKGWRFCKRQGTLLIFTPIFFACFIAYFISFKNDSNSVGCNNSHHTFSASENLLALLSFCSI